MSTLIGQAPAPPHNGAAPRTEPVGLNRFRLVTRAYLVLCLLAAIAIVVRGDGSPPRVMSVYPPNGDRYFPGGLAEITFSQAMDHASVERALQVSPGSQGQAAWYGNTLNLQPPGDWQPNVTYHVTLTGKVTDDQGRPLKTPMGFRFRVHHVGRLQFCTVAGARNVCEQGDLQRPLIPSPSAILSFALSSDGSVIAYTRRDASGIPHLFVVNTDGTGNQQLTYGRKYADSRPVWTLGDDTDVTYTRQPVLYGSSGNRLGKPRTWSVSIDGSSNSPL